MRERPSRFEHHPPNFELFFWSHPFDFLLVFSSIRDLRSIFTYEKPLFQISSSFLRNSRVEIKNMGDLHAKVDICIKEALNITSETVFTMFYDIFERRHKQEHPFNID